ncbi:MAG: hypothetical protein JWP69_1107 [Flaviaesturariibacter sp.]|nr:hypothetical protein [Flaviaesturariibacter sp.]
MSVTELKEELHKAIEENDNPDFLLSLLAAVTNNKLEDADDLSEAQYALLKEREEKYKRGELATITLAEWKEDMKRRYGI